MKQRFHCALLWKAIGTNEKRRKKWWNSPSDLEQRQALTHTLKCQLPDPTHVTIKSQLIPNFQQLLKRIILNSSCFPMFPSFDSDLFLFWFTQKCICMTGSKTLNLKNIESEWQNKIQLTSSESKFLRALDALFFLPPSIFRPMTTFKLDFLALNLPLLALERPGNFALPLAISLFDQLKYMCGYSRIFH